MSRDAGIGKREGPLDGQYIMVWIDERRRVNKGGLPPEYKLSVDEALRLMWDLIDEFEITPGALLDRRLEEIYEEINR